MWTRSLAHRRETHSILDFPGAENILPSSDTLERECDILIPAALENQITETNAPRIQAKIVAEAANGPVTAQAEDILSARGVWIIPDVYLNAGGVTVSYFEWLKNLSHVNLGRMGKRFEQSAFDRILHTVERLTDTWLPEAERRSIVHGADEIDLVNSGLEETMITAYHQIYEGVERGFTGARLTHGRLYQRDEKNCRLVYGTRYFSLKRVRQPL